MLLCTLNFLVVSRNRCSLMVLFERFVRVDGVCGQKKQIVKLTRQRVEECAEVMGNVFRPYDPQYQRRVKVLSAAVCTFAVGQTLMMDHGSQDHIYAPIQKYLYRKIDSFYGITKEELLLDDDEPKEQQKPDNPIPKPTVSDKESKK